jgi:hypothetical protein
MSGRVLRALTCEGTGAMRQMRMLSMSPSTHTRWETPGVPCRKRFARDEFSADKPIRCRRDLRRLPQGGCGMSGRVLRALTFGGTGAMRQMRMLSMSPSTHTQWETPGVFCRKRFARDEFSTDKPFRCRRDLRRLPQGSAGCRGEFSEL